MDIKGTRDRSVSDYKFALIPFIFLFLRMWTAIQSLLLEITSTPPDWLVLPLLYLTVSRPKSLEGLRRGGAVVMRVGGAELWSILVLYTV